MSVLDAVTMGGSFSKVVWRSIFILGLMWLGWGLASTQVSKETAIAVAVIIALPVTPLVISCLMLYTAFCNLLFKHQEHLRLLKEAERQIIERGEAYISEHYSRRTKPSL